MKHYRFKIRPQFLELIENGSKKHEYRLNTPDRSCIKNGDRITLISNQDSSNTLMVKAVSKEVYSSWEDALKENWEEDFKEKYKTFDEVLSVCYKFYDRDMVKKYGIIEHPEFGQIYAFEVDGFGRGTPAVHDSRDVTRLAQSVHRAFAQFGTRHNVQHMFLFCHFLFFLTL